MALIILIGVVAVLVGGFLIITQLISCAYCQHKDKCSNIIEDGKVPPCHQNIKNYNQ